MTTETLIKTVDDSNSALRVSLILVSSLVLVSVSVVISNSKAPLPLAGGAGGGVDQSADDRLSMLKGDRPTPRSPPASGRGGSYSVTTFERCGSSTAP